MVATVAVVTAPMDGAASTLVAIIATEVTIVATLAVIVATLVAIVATEVTVVTTLMVIVATEVAVVTAVVDAATTLVAVATTMERIASSTMTVASSAKTTAAVVGVMSNRSTIHAPEASIPMVGTTVGIEAGVVVQPSVTAAIAPEDERMVIEEVTGVVVAVDGESPGTMQPVEGAQEVVGSGEERILPVEEHIAQVGVAVVEVGTIDIIGPRDAEEVVEVNFVAVVILLVVQVEFVGHLVGEEAGLLTSLFIIHGRNREESAEAQDERENHLFHNTYVFER